MRPTHPFFRGPLASEDLVPCPSHEHQSKHFDRKRWPSVSWHCHHLLPPSLCCLSPFLEEHDVEKSIPSVRSYTHEQKHLETEYLQSIRSSSRKAENVLRQEVQESPPHPTSPSETWVPDSIFFWKFSFPLRWWEAGQSGRHRNHITITRFDILPFPWSRTQIQRTISWHIRNSFFLYCALRPESGEDYKAMLFTRYPDWKCHHWMTWIRQNYPTFGNNSVLVDSERSVIQVLKYAPHPPPQW